MADKEHVHLEAVPLALEAVITQLKELEIVLGPQARPVVVAVREALVHASAARDRGDLPGAMRQIGGAMDRLSTLADQLDPAEGMLMRMVAQSFRDALLRGDQGRAKQDAAVMFEKSGAAERKKGS